MLLPVFLLSLAQGGSSPYIVGSPPPEILPQQTGGVGGHSYVKEAPQVILINADPFL